MIHKLINSDAFNSTSRYLIDLLNIDKPYSEGMVTQIYLNELHLSKAYSIDIEAAVHKIY